jgi:hypothetical protein
VRSSRVTLLSCLLGLVLSGASGGCAKSQPAGRAAVTGVDGAQASSSKPAPLPVIPPPDASAAPPLRPNNAHSPIGTNLAVLADWSAEWPFVDDFRVSRHWVSGSLNEWADSRALDVDEHGNIRSLGPGQIARALMVWGGIQYPLGDYVVLYDGEGELRFPSGSVVESRPGHIVLRVEETGGVEMDVVAVKAHDPLRNVRVLMPGGVCNDDGFKACRTNPDCGGATCVPFGANYASQIFHPIFLDSIKSYSALRFMDWMDTNNSMQSQYADRSKPDDVRWTPKDHKGGAPVEIMVELCNRVGTDGWFNMPHLADDDYVAQFAGYVRDHLRPGLRAYVEYSNEVWNGAFQQAEYARKIGRAAGLSKDDFEAQLRYYSRRSVQIFKIWERVFGGTQRLVRVMGAQAGNDSTSRTVLEFEQASKSTDALAIAPYFYVDTGSPSQADRVRKLSLDALMDELKTKSVPEAIEEIEKQSRIAKRFGLKLVAYESGQHLVGSGPLIEDAKINELFDAANRDPRMKDAYAAYLAGWKKAGGELLMHYLNCTKPSKWGRWGALEGLLQPRESAPKFVAIQEFIARNPRWW